LNVKKYKVEMEIEGPIALFAMPGSEHHTYSIPTYSAAKGMFESIVFVQSAVIIPTAVEICKPVKRRKYTTNYNGPLRSSSSIKSDSPYQLHTIALEDVCFRLYGVTQYIASNKKMTTNPAHALQEMFIRRLDNGQHRYAPCLGFKEFHATYCGPIRPDTDERHVQNHYEFIQTMRHSHWDAPINGSWEPKFMNAVEIEGGRLEYAY